MLINYYTKKIIFTILLIFVSILVVIAIYNNIDKFTEIKIIKYKQIYVESLTDLENLAQEYSSKEFQDIFISEVKELNNLQTSTVVGNNILLVPVIEQ